MSGNSMLVVAGEVSGDQHAGALVAELKQLRPELSYFGLGGPELAAAGVELLAHVDELSVLGLAEVARRYFFFRRLFHRVLEECDRRNCRHALLVDYPGFNLPLARELKQRGVKVLYYVCPQVWAWGRGRIRTMARVVDRLITIFPFEPAHFEGLGLRVDFVGHPLVDRLARLEPEQVEWPGEPHVALLPGSRLQEVKRILPVMLQAGLKVEEQIAGVGFVVASPAGPVAELARKIIGTAGRRPSRIRVEENRTPGVLRGAAAAAVASGTATVEAALSGCPMVVVYRTSWLTYLIGRMLVAVPHLGMVNLIAGRRLCPELIQHRANARLLAAEILRLLQDSRYRDSMVAGLREVAASLGEPGAARRAAEIVAAEVAG